MRPKIFRVLFIVGLLLVPAHKLLADQIFLSNGNIIEGAIIDETDEYLLVDVGGGTVKIKTSEVRKIYRESLDPLESKRVLTPDGVKEVEPKKVKFSLSKYLTEKVKGIMDRQNPEVHETEMIKIQKHHNVKEMSTQEWMRAVLSKTYGANLGDRIASKSAGVYLLGILLGLLVLTILTKPFLKIFSSEGFIDVFIFLLQVWLINNIFMILLRGVIPILADHFFRPGPEMANWIDMGGAIGSGIMCVSVFFTMAKKQLELNFMHALYLLFYLTAIGIIFYFVGPLIAPQLSSALPSAVN